MFDRCVVINLDRRPERLAAFRSRVPIDWAFPPIELVPAFDGSQHEPPAWYGGPNRKRLAGSWGCFQSHLGIYKRAIADGLDSVLIFEDDAVFASDFSERSSVFLDWVPGDWDAIYFGGQHLWKDTTPPTRVNEQVIRGRNVNRTHAYAMGRAMLEKCVSALDRPWPKQAPVNYYNFDFQLGRLHSRSRVYCPTRWLCGQAAGVSDVNSGGRFFSTLWWKEFPIVEPEALACP